MNTLTVSKLAAGYGKRAVVTGADFTLAGGSLSLLVGPNGAGKSTLLRTLSGLQTPISGNVAINGTDLNRMSTAQRARVLSLVSTDVAASGALTVSELVSLGRQPHTGWLGRLSESDRAVVREAIAAVGMTHKAEAFVSDISDGERQKAMIARALAQQTGVMLLDEPTSFLDVAARHEVMALLARIAARGVVVLMSTHDLAAAMPAATNIVTVSHEGRVEMLKAGDERLTEAMNALFGTGNVVYDATIGDFRNCAR